MPDPEDCAGQPAHDPELPGREGPGTAQVVLMPVRGRGRGKTMTIPAESLNARSWLFAPGDSERKMEKATAGTADIVILDLEDAVAEAEKPTARRTIAAFLNA